MSQWFLENSVDLIGHIMTLIGIVSGAFVVAWQLARQHRSFLELQRRNAEEALKLDIYKTLTARLRDLSRTNTEAAIYAYVIPSSIENFQHQLACNIPAAPLTARAETFSQLNGAAQDALIELMQEFEAWSIAFPELELFQAALNSAAHDAQAASIALFNRLLTVLPTDPPMDAPANVPRPMQKPPLSADQLSDLKRLVAEYKRAMDEIGAYVFDLQIEAQNKLLSGLFAHRVPRRKPLDPFSRVLSTEPAEKEALMSYFLNETAWAKQRLRFEAEYKASSSNE